MRKLRAERSLDGCLVQAPVAHHVASGLRTPRAGSALLNPLLLTPVPSAAGLSESSPFTSTKPKEPALNASSEPGAVLGPGDAAVKSRDHHPSGPTSSALLQPCEYWRATVMLTGPSLCCRLDFLCVVLGLCSSWSISS